MELNDVKGRLQQQQEWRVRRSVDVDFDVDYDDDDSLFIKQVKVFRENMEGVA